MDFEAIAINRLTSADESQLREGQQRAFASALSALRQVSRRSLPSGERDQMESAHAAWEDLRRRESQRVLIGAPYTSWLMSCLRARIENDRAPLPELVLGTAVNIPWEGALPVYRLDCVPDIERKLTAEAVYFRPDGQPFEPAVLSDSAGRESWMRSVAGGLAALCKYQPDVAVFYPKFVEYHVPLHPGSPSKGAFGISVTSRDAPGVIGFSEMLPLAQAETLVHECRHNILYAIQELDPLVQPGQLETVQSPWRPDPRPLSGLLHGAFVFDGVCRLYRAMTADPSLSPRNLRAAVKRLVEQSGLLARAAESLGRASTFTAVGQRLAALLAELAREHRAAAATVCGLNQIETMGSGTT
jgi:hypothetical protein